MRTKCSASLLPLCPPIPCGHKEQSIPLSSRRKSVSHSKKFLPCSGAVVVCCLALTTALAFAQDANTKTIVRYPTGHAVSRPLRELPIDVLGLGDMEAPEPKPIPLGTRGVVSPAKSDPLVQKEVRPNVSATKGIDFDGIGAQNFAPSDVNLAIGPNHIVQTVNVL